MKKLVEGEEMPRDFWNYLVNPIVGYYIKPNSEFGNDVERKYGLLSNRNPYDSK